MSVAIAARATVIDDTFGQIKSMEDVTVIDELPAEECAFHGVDGASAVLSMSASESQIVRFNEILDGIPEELTIVDVSSNGGKVRVFAINPEETTVQMLISVVFTAGGDEQDAKALVAIACNGGAGLVEKLKVEGSSIWFDKNEAVDKNQ